MERIESLTQEVIKANDAFYRAFETLDISRMDEVWLHDDTVKCIHPGWRARIGWEAVRDSWIAIFQNTHYMEFTITDAFALVAGDVAWVTCRENLRSVTRGDQNVGVVQATNIFVRKREMWRMVHHHGSPVMVA